MPNNVSLRNIPDEIMEKLRRSAKRHHRSLQGELMAIIEEAVNQQAFTAEAGETALSRLPFKTNGDSTAWLRELRNAR